MPASKPPYAAEFREQMVELARAGRGLKQLSREFGVSANAIRNWGWYNPRRRHSGLGQKSPVDFEREQAERSTSDERRATSDERRATSDERRATSDERRVCRQRRVTQRVLRTCGQAASGPDRRPVGLSTGKPVG